MKNTLLMLVLSVAALLSAADAAAQTKVKVKFSKGATATSVRGIIAGYKYVDYIVGAKSGQTMDVKLDASNAACSFFIYYSDMKEVNEASDVKENSRNVDVDDNYVVRVILPRSAARRRETSRFTLNVSIK